MRARIVVFLLLLGVGVAALRAQVDPPAGGAPAGQAEESVDSSEPVDSEETVTTSTTSTATSVTTTLTTHRTAPRWVHLVRLAAVAGPVAFLLLAWTIGAFVHYRLVHREHEQFPVMRGSRTPQITPMIISAALLFIPVVLFVLFEIRSRQELRLGIGGIVDEWQPVDTRAWTTLLICLVLALIPWLFARRADTVS
jgi:hypothetical protein